MKRSLKRITLAVEPAEGESGILLYGCREGAIQNIIIDNVRLRIGPGFESDRAGGNFDLRPSEEMQTAVFKHGISGIFARFVDRFRIRNMELEWQGLPPEYFTHGIECEAVEGLEINDFHGRQASVLRSDAAIRIDGCADVTVQNCTATDGTAVFLSHSNSAGECTFVNNAVHKARKAIEPDSSVFFTHGNRMR